MSNFADNLHFRQTLSSRLLPLGLFSLLSIVFILSGCGSTAFARTLTVNPNDGLQFSTQMRLGFHSGDDWEPSITSDRYGHIYAMYKHYDVTGGGTCQGCGLHMLFQRSDDGGQTWTAPRAIAPGPFKGKSGQDDPQIVVDPVDGRTVWASYMQNFPKASIDVVKSTDFGATWSTPVVISTPPQIYDKDALVVHGNTIAVGYDDGVNTWAAISLDGGTHWVQHEIFPGTAQFYQSLSAGGGIDSHGNLYFSWNSFDQAHSKTGNGPVTLWITKSTDNGLHWTRTIFGKSGAPPACHPCGFSYFSAQDAMKIGSDDSIYVLWNSSVDLINFAPERVYFARSTDGGKTFSPRVDVSDAPAGVEHCFPALTVGKQAGDVRIAWMDERTGKWNVFFRKSNDGGQHFGSTVRISSFVSGYPYLTPKGYNLPYGDYFQLTVDPANQTVMDFGEGPNYNGPGNIWTAHSLDD